MHKCFILHTIFENLFQHEFRKQTYILEKTSLELFLNTTVHAAVHQNLIKQKIFCCTHKKERILSTVKMHLASTFLFNSQLLKFPLSMHTQVYCLSTI